MKSFFIVLLSILTSHLYAQYRHEYGANLGSSNYLGDIGGASQQGTQISPVDIKLRAQRYSANLYYRYKLTKEYSLRSQIIYTRLYGNDAFTTNPERQARNLSFKSDVLEVTGVCEWNFFRQTNMTPMVLDTAKKIRRKDLRAFLFLGGGFIYFNSKAKLLDKYYSLRPLRTEGVAYKPYTWVIPFGMGLSYTINKRWRFGTDVTYRFTGTDWIDDVSGNYNVSYKDGKDGYLAVKSGSNDINDIRKALGNRTSEVQAYQANQTNYNPELPIGANYDVKNNIGTPRGGNYVKNSSISKPSKPPYKDGYITFNVGIGYVVKGRDRYYKDKHAYILNRRKVVKQRVGGRF